MKLRDLLTDDEIEAIRRATTEAERRTSGEIVPVIVGACDEYDETAWKAAAFGALLAALAAGAAHTLGAYWIGGGMLWITAPAVVGAGAGFLLARIWPGLRRAIVADEILEVRVDRRARQAFLDETVFATRGRTGILIFLALFERRAVILGDEAINRAVDETTWQAIVDRLVAGIRSGATGRALIEAIGECGRLLDEHGLTIQPDDIDELDDRLRLEDR